RSGNDLHQNRIVNGVEAVRSQDDPYLFELDLNSVMGRKLTLGQDYRYGVKLFKVVNGQEIPQPVVANSIKFHLDAAPVPAERGNTFSSVTMITHGFQTQLASIAQNFKSKVLGGPGGEHSLLNEGQWIIQMADQIVEAGGGEKNSNVLLYQKDSGEWRPLPGRGIVASPVAGKPLVLISDWWTESDINDSGFSEAAGDALFASLVNFDKSQGGKIFNSPLHFWSHSRGTIVTSEILQRLGEYENRFLSQQATYHPLDIQFTTLDVHDEFYGPQTNLTPLGIDWTDFNEPSVYAWSNVDFADNYYQILSARQPTIPSTAFPFFASASPDGRLLPSADLNWQFGGRDYQGLTGFLTDDATASHGYVGPHSRMWRWYAGTTDLSVDTFDAYTEPIFRSQADIERFKDLGGGGNLPWYVPQTASATYYDQPGLTTAVLNATWEGIDVGWWYSELGGGKSERPTGGQRVALFTDNTAAGETKVTPELTVWSDSKIPTLFNGDFEAGNMQRDSRVYAFGGGGRKVSTPGWAYHQDPTIGNTDGFVTRDVKIEPYTLLNGSVGHAAELSSSRVTQLVHNRFYIPMEAQFVQLKYLVKEVEYGRDSTGSQVPRLPNIDVLVRIGTDEYRLGTIPTSSDSLLPFQTTPQMSLISAVNVKTGATRDLRREVGELIIRLTFDANAPTFITGQTTRARVWIDDVRLGPTGAALQADPVDHTTATMTTLHLTNLTSLLETSKLIWGSGFDYIEPPNGVIGLTLGDQQGLTTLHSTPEQGNLDEHGSTGSGEGGLDDQCLFESSSTTLKFVGENQSAAAAGTFPLVEGLAGATAETDQIRGDGHPALAADSHAVQAQGDAGLLEGQQATLLPAVRNEPVSDHAPVGHDGAFIGEGAVLIPHNQLGGDPASGGGDGAVTNLNILQLQQLTLEPLIFLNDFCPVGGGPEGPGSILAAARLNETDEQQGQSIVSHDPSFGTPTLPPDRRFVNSSDGLSGFSGLSSAGASSGPNNSQLTTQNSTLSPEQLSLLGRATIAIDDLPDGYLALTLGTTITLDTDAAGYGWFIDPTPGVHEEFDYTPLSSEALAKEDSSPWQLQAAPGSAAEGKIDLMTVLMHELGHVMGLGHVSSAVDGTRLMAGAIDPGIRRLPSALDLGPEPSSDPNHSVLSPQSSSLDV
ncbi:MAG: M10 family metallopeptidase domain-containing protein, partial [Nitrospira sp.]|nr:M10 family metallopeptidase domain-containing protein [Nitrospira sp.]